MAISGIVMILHADLKELLSLFVFLDVQCPLFLKCPKVDAIGQEKLSVCKQSKHMEACKTNRSFACSPNFLAITATNTCVAGICQAGVARRAHAQMRT